MPPAARVGDLHTCPLSDGPKPHVGGPVMPPGAPTVMIGGPFAARVTDMCTCTGPPDAIAKGAFTTLVGGLPAARQTDMTMHGGLVTVGLPTVMIGDTPPGVTVVQRGKMFIIVNSLNNTMYIVGTQQFSGNGATQAFVDAATAAINNAWSGNATIGGVPYKVECMVQGQLQNPGDPANPAANPVVVTQTTMTPSEHKNKDPAHVDGNGVTHVHANEDDGGTMTIPHEFGHTMGLPDEYQEGPRNPDGSRSITRTGPAGGLMGYIDPGSKPTNDNYNSLVTGSGLKP